MKPLLMALGLMAFSIPVVSQFAPDPPGPLVVGKKGVVVAGDTLTYTISWGPGARATSYTVATGVAGTNGTWTAVRDSNGSGSWVVGNGVGPLPVSANVTFTSVKTWVAASPWDSATFTVTVVSRNAIGISAPVTATWKVSRKPGVPGPITIDSSLLIVGVRILPDSVRVQQFQTVQFCGLVRFANGAYALRAIDRDIDSPECPVLYQQTIAPALRVVSAAQQARADSVCILWSTTDPTGSIVPEPCVGTPALLQQRGLLFTTVIATR